ncbi:MAG: polyphosphate polymerase domain-containing protein [Clostridia bacterium]|nr:polyphosphate polymerase domain-containing protein [Clostridia bacterium]
MPGYRHELKIRIDAMDAATLLPRLRAVLRPDPNAPNGEYTVRSLYYDDPYGSVLADKLAGMNQRDKYRLRIYNGSDGTIRLERKERIDGVGRKLSVPLTRDQADRFLAGGTGVLLELGDPVATLFYGDFQAGALRPRRIVEYDRTAFVHPLENVRITLDRRLRGAPATADFFRSPAVPVPMACDVLEVKYDRYLPSHIADLVRMDNHFAGPNSKYLNCSLADRMF